MREDLRWLGLDWEVEQHQSRRAREHDEFLQTLCSTGRVYGCDCTHAAVAGRSATAAADGAAVYDGHCRGKPATDGRVWRLDVTDLPDAATVGDVVVRGRDGGISYHAASVADDLDAGVTQVVRGHDLAASTVRQTLVARVLGTEHRLPTFRHVPLVVGGDGRKLGKRHGDTRLRSLREAGVEADRLRGVLGRWSGIDADWLTLQQWCERFDLARLPPEPTVYDDPRDRPSLLWRA